MLYVVCIIIGFVLARLFWRQLMTVLAWAVVIAACVALLRLAPSFGLPRGWLMQFYGVILVGVPAVVFLGYRIVVNFLVERDFERDVDRARGTADKRRV